MLGWEMKIFPAALAFLPLLSLATENPAPQFDAHAAERFARLALACVPRNIRTRSATS